MPTRDELLQQLYSMDHEPDENDRRRRIARRLRASGIETRVWCAPASAQDTLDDIVCATDFVSSEAKTMQEHLADLIEPEPERTCRNLGGDGEMLTPDDFTCSECGFWLGYTRIAFVYCPKCGAKVVKDED